MLVLLLFGGLESDEFGVKVGGRDSFIYNYILFFRIFGKDYLYV